MEKRYTSASGVDIRLRIQQKRNSRGLALGDQSPVTLTYGDGGEGKVFECRDTQKDTPKLLAALARFQKDEDLKGQSLIPAPKPKRKPKGGEE